MGALINMGDNIHNINWISEYLNDVDRPEDVQQKLNRVRLLSLHCFGMTQKKKKKKRKRKKKKKRLTIEKKKKKKKILKINVDVVDKIHLLSKLQLIIRCKISSVALGAPIDF